MVQIPRREWKLYKLKQIQGGNCACGCGKPLYRERPDEPPVIVEPHHQISDNAGNRREYPLFIHSILCLQAVRKGCHDGYTIGAIGHITPFEAERYENFLRRHPRIADFVNGKSLFLFRKG